MWELAWCTDLHFICCKGDKSIEPEEFELTLNSKDFFWSLLNNVLYLNKHTDTRRLFSLTWSSSTVTVEAVGSIQLQDDISECHNFCISRINSTEQVYNWLNAYNQWFLPLSNSIKACGSCCTDATICHLKTYYLTSNQKNTNIMFHWSEGRWKDYILQSSIRQEGTSVTETEHSVWFTSVPQEIGDLPSYLFHSGLSSPFSTFLPGPCSELALPLPDVFLFVCFLFHPFHSVLSHTGGINAWITRVEPQSDPPKWWLVPLFVLALPENVILIDNLFRETEWKTAIAVCTPLRYKMDPRPSSHQGYDWGGGTRPFAAMPNSPAPLKWSSAQQTATLSLRIPKRTDNTFICSWRLSTKANI